MSRVVLLSGGMDSAALALWQRPDIGLFLDYGQPSAASERRASLQVRDALGMDWAELEIDCSPIGAETVALDGVPAATWWPYRNSLLLTFAAAWSVGHGADTILIGTVSTDGDQHRDGTTWFIAAIDKLISGQEGGVRVRAPAITLTSEDLCRISGGSRSFLAGTHSCHRSNVSCGDCGGCRKRDEVLEALFPRI